jgi:signal transduction histidine kinase
MEVSDSGLGIKLEDQAKMFILFGFADQNNMNRNGIGLGLVISRGIAQKLGGDITFVSTPGKGTTFTLTFEIASESHN